eukprot:1962943-Ditylum_brightwellii.AAC.1
MASIRVLFFLFRKTDESSILLSSNILPILPPIIMDVNPTANPYVDTMYSNLFILDGFAGARGGCVGVNCSSGGGEVVVVVAVGDEDNEGGSNL